MQMDQGKWHPEISSEKFYHALYNNYLCGMIQYYSTEKGLRVIGINKMAQKIYGVELAEDYFDRNEIYAGFFTRAEHRQQFTSVLESLKEPGDSVPYENPVQNSDGSVVWVMGEAKLISVEDGKKHILCFFMDISERKRYEESLMRERDRYNAIFQNVPCAIVQYEYRDGERVVLNFNDEAWRMLKYRSREAFWEAQARGGGTKTLEEDVPYTKMLLEKMTKHNRPVSFAHRIVCADGEIKWICGRSETSVDPDGSEYYQSVFIDDTLRREEELKKENGYKKEISDMTSAPDTLFSKIRFNVTTNRMEQYIAKSEIAISGAESMTYDEFLAVLLSQIVDKEEREKTGAALARRTLKESFDQGKSSAEVMIRRRRRDKTFIWIRMTIKLVQEPNTRNLIGFAYSAPAGESHSLNTRSGRLMEASRTAIEKLFLMMLVLDYQENRYDVIRYNCPEKYIHAISGSLEEIQQILCSVGQMEKLEIRQALEKEVYMRELVEKNGGEYVFHCSFCRDGSQALIECKILPLQDGENHSLYLMAFRTAYEE